MSFGLKSQNGVGSGLKKTGSTSKIPLGSASKPRSFGVKFASFLKTSVGLLIDFTSKGFEN
jgi:hypothetical protein